jgi:hypothetical protein
MQYSDYILAPDYKNCNRNAYKNITYHWLIFKIEIQTYMFVVRYINMQNINTYEYVCLEILSIYKYINVKKHLYLSYRNV